MRIPCQVSLMKMFRLSVSGRCSENPEYPQAFEALVISSAKVIILKLSIPQSQYLSEYNIHLLA